LTLEELDRELAEKNLFGFWSGNIVGLEENIEPKRKGNGKRNARF